MGNDEIKKEIQDNLLNISLLNANIRFFRQICKHEDTTRKYRADTGNYDPSQDRYWIECVCEICGKHWTEDQ